MTRTTPTVAAAMKAHPLAPAVLRQLGGGKDAVETAIEAGEHGADAGWHGFTTYTNTVAFFKRHRAAICSAVMDMAGELGEPAAEMVAGFQCLGGQHLRAMPHTYDERRNAERRQSACGEYLPSVYRCLGGGRLTDDDTNVANALAWFALEEVGRAIADLNP